ncbi:TIGR03016 family PEP-CTERM system-associated outer membrane protein [Massilia horti]|nr:TIGR03016 family PEP-CTERM system-associated outer membrane protein [Massilia horti]
MADRSGAGPALPARALLPLLVALACAPASAELKFIPGVTLTETWTDNVNLAEPALARREWITDLAPSFALVENNRRLQLNASYQFHVYNYSDKTAPNIYDNNRQLQANLKARVVDELLFLDAAAMRGQQAISAFAPQVEGAPYSSFNRTEVSTWRVSPYLAHRLGGGTDLMLRYTRDSVQTNQQGYGNTHADSVTASASSRPGVRLGWNLRYDRQHLVDKLAGDSVSTNEMAGLSYRVQPSLAVRAAIGHDNYDYHALGGRSGGGNWNIGFDWTPSPRTSLSASTGHRYYGQSHALNALHRSRHTVWSFNYDEAVTTTRSQFLLPATIDTADLLDRLFMPNIPDPVARRQAVEAYLRATGLPASLAENVNYLSNRYMLQKQFQASAGFNGAHSMLLLSLFDTRRTALSLQQTDSQLLGSHLSNLNDDVRMKGAAANFNYSLSSRSQASVSLTSSRSNSLSTGLKQDNRALRVGLSRRFQRKLYGSVEARHAKGTAIGGGRTYTENAVSASLSLTL